MRQPERSPFVRHPVALAACLLGWPAAFALPQGGTPTFGQTDIRQNAPGQLTINQGSARAGIDWTSFSIGAGERVQVIQPGRDSVLVNRVVGNDPSSIFGQLQSNGNVWLINPRGIFFGASSRIDVGGLVATTLNLEGTDASSGRIRLGRGAEGAGEIRSEGQITARDGTVVLAAPQVTQSGTIEARRVGVAAATQVDVDVEGDGLIFFNARNDGTLDTRLKLLGNVLADGGTADLRAAARAGFADTVLNLDGVVRARSIGQRNGRVFIDGGSDGAVIVTGTVDASGNGTGERGGDVTITGQGVGLARGALVDASGDAGGGRIRVGGGFHGADTDLRNAGGVVVLQGATLAANAGRQGDGGQVVVWSDGHTLFGGEIQARGGAQGGDGGQAEVSSKGYLAYDGRVDMSAARGRAGSLLLDPQDIEIIEGSGPGPDNLPDLNGDLNPGDDLASPTLAAGDYSGTSRITADKVQFQLASSSVSLAAIGNITVKQDISYTGSNSLTLTAGSTIEVQKPVEVKGGITLNATSVNVNGSAGNTGSLKSDGTILINASGASTASGTISAGTLQMTGNGTLTLASAGRLLATSALVVDSGSTLKLGGNETAVSLSLGGTLSGTNAADTLTAITYNLTGANASVAANLGTGTLNSSGTDVSLTGTAAAGTVHVTGGNLTLGSGNRLTGATTITVDANSTLTLGGSESTTTLNLDGTLAGSGHTLTATTYNLTGAAASVTADLGAGTLNSSGNAVSLAGTAAAGTVHATGGNLTLGSGNRLTGATTITVDANSTLTLGGSESTTTLNLNGTLAGSGHTLTATTYNLTGAAASVAANLGAGTVNSSGANVALSGSAAGNVHVTGGTLTLGSGGRLSGTSTITIDAGRTLTLGGNESVAALNLDGTLAGIGQTLTATTYNLTGAAASVTANLGAGTINSSGNNVSLTGTAAAGTVNVTGGTLALGSTGRLTGTAAAINVSGNGTLRLGGNESAGTLTLNGGTLDAAAGGQVLSVTSLSSSGASALQSVINTGTVNVTGGTLSLASAGRLAGTPSITVDSNATLSLGGAETATTLNLDGTLAGSGQTLTASNYNLTGASASVTANLGAGTLTSSGTNVSLAGTANANTVNVTGGTLALGSTGRLTGTPAAINVSGNGTLRLGGNESAGTLTLNGGTLDAAAGGQVLSVTSLSSGGTSALQSVLDTGSVHVTGGTLSLASAGRLAGTPSITVDGGATLSLGGAETASTLDLDGTLAGSGQTLTASNYNLTGASAGVTANLGAGTINSSGNNVSLAGTAAAATVNVTAGRLTLSGNNRLTATTTVAVGSATLRLDGDQRAGAVTLAGGTIDRAGVNDQLTAAALSSTGSSMLQASVSTGTVNVTGGTLTLGAANLLAGTPTVDVANLATLALGGNLSVGAISGNGTIDVGSGTLTSNVSGAAAFGGTLAGTTGGFTKDGSGSFTLSGSSTYTGTTRVAAGTLVLASAGRLGSGGSLAVDAGATLTLGGNETVVDATLAGTLNAAHAGDTLSATNRYDLTGAATLVNANLGGGNLFSSGSGVTLNGTSAAANVTVSGGTLSLGSGSRFTGAGTVTVANGATLRLNGSEAATGVDIGGTLLATNAGDRFDATTYTLSGNADVQAALGAGTLEVTTGANATLRATSDALVVNVRAGGVLHLGTDERLNNDATLTLVAGSGLALNGNERVGTALLSGSVTKTHPNDMLTAGHYTLGTGANIAANLGPGGLDVAGDATLGGTSASVDIDVLNGGTLRLGGPNRLDDSAHVIVRAGGTLVLGGHEKVGVLEAFGTVTSGTVSADETILTGGTLSIDVDSVRLTSSGTSRLEGQANASTVSVTSGTLTLGGADRFTNSPDVTINGGASLALLGQETFGSLAGGGQLDLGTSLLVTGVRSSSRFDGTITGGAGALLRKSGALTTFTLGGASGYGGALDIAEGTLAVAAGGGFAPAADLTVAAGAVLDTSAALTVDTIAISGTLAGSGSVGAGQSTLLDGGTISGQLAGHQLTTSGHASVSGRVTTDLLQVGQGGHAAGADTLLLASGGRLGAATVVTVASPAELALGGDESAGGLQLQGLLSGSGTFTAPEVQLSGGTAQASLGGRRLVSVGNSTLAGTSGATQVDIQGGTLQLAAPNRLTAPTVAVSVSNGATLVVGGATTVGSLSLAGTLSGPATLQAGSATLSGGVVDTGAHLVSASVSSGGASRIDGLVDTANLDVTGGQLTLGAAERLSDTTQVTVATGASLTSAATETVARIDLDGSLDGAGPFVAGTLALAGGTANAQVAGTRLTSTLASRLNGGADFASVSVDGGRLTLGSAGRLAAGTVLSVAAPATLSLGGSETVANATLSGTLAGSGTLNATTMTLAGGSAGTDIAGTSLASSGNSRLDGTARFSSVAVDAGTLTLGSAGRIAGTPAVAVAGGATLALGGAETFGSLGGAGTVALGAATLTTGSGGDSTFAGSLQGDGGRLTKVGAGRFTLSGANTYTGRTDVQAGTLALDGDNRLSAQTLVQVLGGATLAVTGEQAMGGLDLQGTLSGSGAVKAPQVTLAGGTVAAGVNGGDLFASGSSTIAAAVAPATISVTGGTLRLAAPDLLADGTTLTVAAPATLTLGGNDTVGSAQISGRLDGSGRLTAATIALDGATVLTDLGGGTLGSVGSSRLEGNAAVDALAVNGGTLTLVGGGRLSGTPAVAVAAGARLALGGDEAVGTLIGLGTVELGSATLSTTTTTRTTFDGRIEGSGGLVKRGSGDFVLSGQSTYTGSTQVAQGALELQGTASLATSAYQVDGTLRFANSGNVDLAAPVSGSGALEQAGSGTLTLVGDNKSYSGPTRVLAGTLDTGSAHLNAASAVSVAAGATLDFGAAQQVASVDVDGAGHLKLNGDLAASGALSLLGDVQVQTTAPVALSGTTIDAPNAGNLFGSRLSLTASGAVHLQSGSDANGARDLTLGELSLGGGGRIDAGVITLDGLAQLTGGTLELASSAARGRPSLDPATLGRDTPGGRQIAFSGDVVAQNAGSRIEVAEGAQLTVIASNGGSIRLLADDNRFAGGLEVRSGAIAQTPWDARLQDWDLGNGSQQLSVQDRVQVAGSTVTVAGAGIEADIVTIRADHLSTAPGAVIAARLPFDNRVGTADSLPGLTLELTPVAFGLPFPFGQAGAEISVSVGSRAWGASTLPIDAGYLRVLPRHGAQGATAVILTGPLVSGGYGFFFDGAGQSGEIPVFYNGALPVTPEVSGSLSATLAVSEGARRERFDESVRTENVAVRLRAGVIAEVGPGRPATVGSEGLKPPASCAPAGESLACEAN